MSAKRPAPLTRIVNRGRGHSYYLDGEKVPGVTTILDNGIPKPALVGWAARTVSEYVIDRLALQGETVCADDLVASLSAFNETRKFPERLGNGLARIALTKILSQVHYADRDAAGNRGGEVHRLAEQLARGNEIDVPDELAGHVKSYVAFLDEWDPTNALLERVVVSRRWKYMGRLDLIADFPQYGRGLVDVKTSRSGPFGEVGLQLAGYRYAETLLAEEGDGEEPMPAVDWCGVVWVRADGYDVYRYDVDESTFRTFLYAKQVGEWLDRDNGPAGSIKSDALPAPVLEEEKVS